MTAQPDQGIRRELSLGEVLSKTFELYKRGFTKYFLLFAVVGVIMNVSTKLVRQAFPFPILPPNPTPQQLSSFLGGLYSALFLQLGVTFAITILLSPVAQGSAVELASEQIRKGKAGLGRSFRFALSRLPGIWAVNIIVGIIVFLGFIALIIPGIILAIMFSLALPVLLIEGRGPLDSMGRSRVLVSHRWLNTFATFLVIGLIAGIALLIISAITGLFGLAGAVANGILSGLFAPLFPIVLTVYYYSNLARVNSPPPPPPWGQMPTFGGTPSGQMRPGGTAAGQMPVGGTLPGQTPMSGAPTTGQTGTTPCPTCGTLVGYWVAYCPNCGAKINQDWTR